jgi:predicted metal-binding membrane protein
LTAALDRALERVLRRDQIVVAAALAALALAAWAWLLSMAAMDMSGHHAHALPRLAAIFVMWAVMMVGMMTPSAAPMILLYARVGRQAQRDGKPFAAIAWFAGGYLAAWIGFSLIATAAHRSLAHVAILTREMASGTRVFSAVVLVAAGLYQWSSLKDRCLANCRSPLAFVQRHGGFRRALRAALRLGLLHGLYCIGCCWALMALVFVGGVMNVLWIAAIAAAVLAEKVLPFGRTVSRTAGAALVVAGLWIALA